MCFHEQTWRKLQGFSKICLRLLENRDTDKSEQCQLLRLSLCEPASLLMCSGDPSLRHD